MSDTDPDEAVEAWHESDESEDRTLITYLMNEFDWTQEETENWIATGKAPVRDV